MIRNPRIRSVLSHPATFVLAFWLIGSTFVADVVLALPHAPGSDLSVAEVDKGPTNRAPAFPETTLWSEGFEGNWFLNWTVEAGTWEAGAPTAGPGAPFSGLNVAATVLAGNYDSNVDSKLIRTKTFVVPDASENPRLRFWQWFSFSSGDHGEVQISTDGGTTWETISISYVNTGSGVWSRPSLALSAYAGMTALIAFDLHSDGNGVVSTGWYIDDVMVVTGSPVLVNPEGFESGLSDWAVESGTWEVGEATTGPGACRTGTGCAGSVLSGNYHSNVSSRLVSATFTVPPAAEMPRLLLWHWFSFSSGDNGEVQISTDQGASWTTLLGPFINTSSGVWSPTSISLVDFADQTAQIAFNMQSDGNGVVSTGWYIDDIQFFCGEEDCLLPVELVSWEATLDDDDALLRWTTASETNNAGFDLEHRPPAGAFSSVGFVPGAGTTIEPRSYAYRINNLGPGEHAFRLKQIDFDGTFEYSEVIQLAVQLQDQYKLSKIHPNPLVQSASFTLSVPTSDEVRIELYDLVGRRRAVVYEGPLAANDPRQFNVEVGALPNGVYLVRVAGQRFMVTRRVVVVR